MPESLVVRTWQIALQAGSSGRGLVGVAPDVRALVRDATGPNSPRLRADTVAAASVSRFFSDYASKMRASSIPLFDAAYDAADSAGAAAAELRPRSASAWASLAQLRLKTGALRGAFDAVSRAAGIAPNDAGILRVGAGVALAVGESRFAADAMERALERMDERERAALPAEFLLLYARALAADGTLRVPDPGSEMGLRFRFDIAAELIQSLPGPMDIERRRQLYDVYLRYGDLLASIDRPAMALLAYTRAHELTGGNVKQMANEHGAWLQGRLVAETAAAKGRLDEAYKNHPEQIAIALMDLYVAFCRETRWTDADELFAKLQNDLKGVPTELRLRRAVHRFAALEDREDQERAEKDLREILRTEPGHARARYELARVLEWQGTIERLEEARNLYYRAARDALLEDWSLDAAERADLLDEVLRAAKH